ncbi:hypothetical protein [Streptomyces profundus]|uniref:hypothetical protein n=1 Tax=Streptomyces profundus TaxID=2867410 RepID=UPI001D15F6CE|nr:hypothetical protein [Streptomyces sp. MA3_2.13]UED87145.1 hypothetical protein K4G22_25485 [Streptomyces sp. MA3_2.13]
MPDASMTEREWNVRLTAFCVELRALADALDPTSGWFAAFDRRNGAELSAWLAGRALPPWDAVADLVQDLAVRGGPEEARRATGRLRAHYVAAVRAHDELPGGQRALTLLLADLDRTRAELDARLRMLAHAEETARRLGQLPEAERLTGLAEWARDDQERMVARRAEAHARLVRLSERPPGTLPRTRTAQGATATPTPPRDPPAAEAPVPARKRAKQTRRPRGARFAGIEEPDEPGPTQAPEQVPTAAPEPAPPAGALVRPPSGSRFAGALRDQRPTLEERVSQADREAAARTVDQLRELRARGQSGAAHGLLSEAAGGSAVRLALLLAELERVDLGAETTTLLWEAGSLPPEALAAAAEALSLAGRERDCDQLLRQGAARPAAEVGSVAAALREFGLGRQAVTLLRGLVRARTAEEAAQAARTAPDVLVPILLAAAREVSPSHHFAVTSELRRAGVA